MPRLSMYTPELAIPDATATSAETWEWCRRSGDLADDGWEELIAVLAWADLHITNARCCTDPDCSIVSHLEKTMRRVWRMIPDSQMVRAFGERGAATLTAD